MVVLFFLTLQGEENSDGLKAVLCNLTKKNKAAMYRFCKNGNGQEVF